MDNLEHLPYKVYDQNGTLVMQAVEECRYKKNVELSLLEAGYTIKLHGKKITKKEIKQ